MSYVNPILARQVASHQTPDAINDALDKHYKTLERFIQGVAMNKYHMIVNGPSGCGKTEYTRKVLDSVKANAVMISGTMSPIKLYAALYECRKPGTILVIDDTDTLLEQTESLEILKAALDSQGNKPVAWKKYSTLLAKNGMPDEFLYKGRLIIITNKHLSMNDTTKAGSQLVPVRKRFQYFPAGLPSKEWEVLAMRKFVEAGDVRIFNERNIPKNAQQDIMNFIEANADDLGRISFRSIVQCVELYEAHGEDWQDMALISLAV
jgi:hypothetical protein